LPKQDVLKIQRFILRTLTYRIVSVRAHHNPKLLVQAIRRTFDPVFAGFPICGPTGQTGTTLRHMFDILVYLFENYYTPQACPEADVLAKRLAAAGFEHDDIDDALGWLYGLAETTERCVDLNNWHSSSARIYTDSEYQQLGSESIGFITFLETAGILPTSLREIVIDRALAAPEAPVSLATIKVVALMVLWSQEADIDHLILEELLDDDSSRPLH
jgi:Smg protein